MSLLRLAYVVALRRTVFNWKLEIVLLLGILLAVTLMSSGIIFSDLVAEASLGRTMSRATPEEANFLIRSSIGRETPATVEGRASAYRGRVDVVDRRIGDRFKPHLLDRARLLEAPTFFFQGHPQLELDDDIRPRGNIEYLRGLAPDRVELVQGRWPYSDGDPFTPGELEVVVDELGSQLLRLGAGNEMEMFPAASFTDPPLMTAKIVGVFQKTDPDDEFWYPTAKDFSFKNDRWTTIPLFTTEDGIFQQVVGRYPSLFLNVTWYFYLDRQGIRGKEVNQIQDASREAKQIVNSQLTNGSIRIKLDSLLDDYKDRLLPTRVPLFLIVFLVTGILIYYLGLICGLMIRSRSTELAMLKSRGATTSQLGLLAFVESLLLAAPAVAAGPFLAQGIVQLLGKFFFGLGGAGELAGVPVSLSSQAFLLGLTGGLLAVIGLTGFTLLAARQSMVEFRQAGARPPRVPFIHRYYLDVMLLAVILVLWWQTQSQDSFLVRSVGSGELKIDWSSLLGAMLWIVIVGLLALRLFPLGLAFLARLLEPVGPSWIVHGMRHISRDPIVPGVLIVMLMLATALGVIGSTFSSTLERGQRDRVLYEVGSDLRIEFDGTNTPAPMLGLAALAEEDELVEGAAEVRRMNGSVLTKGISTSSISILGVDTSKFHDVAWYRPDFARGKSLSEVISPLAPNTESRLLQRDGILLPRDSKALALWVQPSRPDPNMRLRARLKDANGHMFNIHITPLGFRGWERVRAELVPLAPPRGRVNQAPEVPIITSPYTFLFFYISRHSQYSDAGALFLGDLSAVTPFGEELIDDFQNLERWHVLEDYSRPDVSYYAMEQSELVPPRGNVKSAVFSWAPGGVGLWGARSGEPEAPVPAVVSRSLLKVADVQVGDTLNISLSTFILQFQVAAVADYFPTLDPEDKPFAVVDLRTFNQTANLHSPSLVGGSDELWVNLVDPKVGAEAVASNLDDGGLRVKKSLLASELVSQAVDQPLVNVGWGGLLVLVFLVLVLASASGVMLFSYIDTRERQTEFALLRALGSSTKQQNGVVWFSIFLVVLCGIGLGSWVGFQTGADVLPLMDTAEEGTRVAPPLVLQANWTTLLVSYLVLAGVTVFTVLWLAWISARMEILRALRIRDG